MRYKHNVVLIILGIIMPYLVSPAADARYTADFLTFGVGARALAMGGAGTALSDSTYAAYWNPAGLGNLDRYEISFMHSTFNGQDSYDFVSYSHPLKNWGALNCSWLRVGTDDILITALPVTSRPVGPTNRPKVVGTFTSTDNAFLLSSGWSLPSYGGVDFRMGGTLKLLYMSGYRSTNAIGGGADVGFLGMLAVKTGHRLRFGVQVSDVFRTKVYWNTPPPSADEISQTETISQNFKIGVATTHELPVFRSSLILALDTYIKNGLELHGGAEWTFLDLLSLRLGFEDRLGHVRIRRLTGGVGLSLRFVAGTGAWIDYAFANHPALGSSHRISLRIRF